jgi:outer membrane phospholipase A
VTIDYGLSINVLMVTFRAENCYDSCWISVGDDPDPRSNPECGDAQGYAGVWIKKHCDLKGRYVSLLGWNPNYSYGSGNNYMYFADLKSWSLPDIVPSQI